jgi:hypothetical protein
VAKTFRIWNHFLRAKPFFFRPGRFFEQNHFGAEHFLWSKTIFFGAEAFSLEQPFFRSEGISLEQNHFAAQKHFALENNRVKPPSPGFLYR